MAKKTFIVVFLAFGVLLYSCGGGSGSDHSLEGTWAGYLYIGGDLEFTIDGSGEITELLLNGSPSTTFLEGYVDDNPEIYTMTWDMVPSGPISFPFLTDSGQEHGGILLIYPGDGFALVGALEKGGATAATFYPSDILGTWSGYGYAYSHAVLDFAPFSPVVVEAVSEDPLDSFTVSLPAGTLTGTIDHAGGPFYLGSADQTGADVWMVMSPDKQFVAVEAIPPDNDSIEDVTFFVLNRE